MDLFLVFAVVFIALVFSYTNGFHDTANAIATVVGTKVLTPREWCALSSLKSTLATTASSKRWSCFVRRTVSTP